MTLSPSLRYWRNPDYCVMHFQKPHHPITLKQKSVGHLGKFHFECIMMFAVWLGLWLGQHWGWYLHKILHTVNNDTSCKVQANCCGLFLYTVFWEGKGNKCCNSRYKSLIHVQNILLKLLLINLSTIILTKSPTPDLTRTQNSSVKDLNCLLGPGFFFHISCYGLESDTFIDPQYFDVTFPDSCCTLFISCCSCLAWSAISHQACTLCMG